MPTILRRVRLARGQSLRELADDIGCCSHATLARLENGQPGARPRTRLALERALGVPFDVLTQDDKNDAATQPGMTTPPMHNLNGNEQEAPDA